MRVGMAVAALLGIVAVAVLVAGLSEAFIPIFVAFAFLAVAWLLVAMGLRRSPA